MSRPPWGGRQGRRVQALRALERIFVRLDRCVDVLRVLPRIGERTLDGGNVDVEVPRRRRLRPARANGQDDLPDAEARVPRTHRRPAAAAVDEADAGMPPRPEALVQDRLCEGPRREPVATGFFFEGSEGPFPRTHREYLPIAHRITV